MDKNKIKQMNGQNCEYSDEIEQIKADCIAQAKGNSNIKENMLSVAYTAEQNGIETHFKDKMQEHRAKSEYDNLIENIKKMSGY